ncbi:MAG: DPP IV N-terminal domain-containing protein, partial [Muribaculaceae bacterium]|nr:DPP IV N-terminal domain-containing protein [Muribaculaceae bacterium]
MTVEDFCNPKVCAPAGINTITPLADGESYSAISEDGNRIEIYSYKTGKMLSTLFDVNAIKGDVKIDSFDGYKLSANEKKILLWNDVTPIYRRSFTAQYFVYDIMRGTLKRVSENGRQRDAVMSHDGRMVAYIRDNNIFISNLDYGTDYAVTTDGEVNKIINGSADWSYEEEFYLVNTIRWSKDDNLLAFVRFDESEVPVYGFDNYKSYCDENPLSDLYPSAYTYKYPLAGYPNSKVTVHSYNLDTRITKTMDLPIGSDYVPSIEFDGEGTNLMVMLLNRDQNDLRLYKVNPGSTVAHLVISETSNAWLSPDAYQ